MSEDHADQPAGDLKLTDDLARLESILGAVTLPPSRIQRDELMFRAGRAAEASAESQRFKTAGKRATLAWSVSSATVAASLAVAITMWLQTIAVVPLDSVAKSSGDLPAGIAGVEAEEPTSRRQTNPVRSHFATRAGVNKTAPLLVMRDRILLQPCDEGWTVTESSVAGSSARDGIPSRAKTSREMLQEFLPRGSSRSAVDRNSNPSEFDWPWNTKRLGATS